MRTVHSAKIKFWHTKTNNWPRVRHHKKKFFCFESKKRISYSTAIRQKHKNTKTQKHKNTKTQKQTARAQLSLENFENNRMLQTCISKEWSKFWDSFFKLPFCRTCLFLSNLFISVELIYFCQRFSLEIPGRHLWTLRNVGIPIVSQIYLETEQNTEQEMLVVEKK